MPSFNLVEGEWIPCIVGANSVNYGIRRTLADAHKIIEVFHPSPLITLAIHRLLLAILHRNFGPADASAWRSLWDRGKFDPDALDGYFRKWDSEEQRFDLFDEQHPFYQCLSLPFEPYEIPLSKLAHELHVPLFDHTMEADAPAFSPAEAARMILACQAFHVGGLITFEHGQNRRLFGSADAAPLTKQAVALVKGADLFQTLMLNLHSLNYRDESPFLGNREEDVPAWERDEETLAEDSLPAGYLDLLTWQSRRIRLHTEDNGTVRFAVMMKGRQFADVFHPKGHETMVAFRRNPDAKGNTDPWPAVVFREDRALWRDCLPLLQSLDDGQQRPMNIEWLNDLVAEGCLHRSEAYPLSISGLCSDRAKVFFWRHERLPLPLAYLDDADLVAALAQAIHLAEDVGEALRSAAWALARHAVVPAAPADKPLNKQQKAEVRKFAESLAPGRVYWASLDSPFRRLMAELPDDTSTTDGATIYGVKQLPDWRALLKRSALAAFISAIDGLDRSARTLRAIAKAEESLRLALHRTLEAPIEERR